jgi:hypothetical protein
MCIVAAKFFPEIGWVAIKNRDRNYIPELSFKREDIEGKERLLYKDDITQYREGLNDKGVCILSASLLVIDDEKEIKEPNRSHSKDGDRISKALKCSTVSEAVKSLIKSKLTGNTLILDRDNLVLMEASNRDGKDGKKEFVFTVKNIPKSETVVRTNHGIELPWAGYQNSGSENEKLSRKSSESRLKIAEKVVKEAKTPQAILDLLCKKYDEDPQMNPLRTTTDQKKMRTTSQIMLIPSEKTMYVRPIQSSISYNFWKMDDPEADTWVEILSNKPLWQNHSKGDNGSQRLKHLA